MFGRFKRKPNTTQLSGDKAMGQRAERDGAPARIINSFADFAAPDQTVRVATLEEYLFLLKGPIAALRQEIAFDDVKFERLVLPMIHRYLAWVHLLPASATHHHSRLGGLAIHGLDVATLAARHSHNAVLDFDPAFTRDLELRANRRSLWPLAAATAGLHHDLGKVLIDQVICCADTGEVWNPFVRDLLSWAKASNVTRYAVRWRNGDRLHRHESVGLLLMGSIAGNEVLGALGALGRDVVEAIVMSVSGERDDEATGVRQMVHKADAESSKLDRDSGSAYWSEAGASADPVLGRLMDAAAQLVRKRAWKINTAGHPIWVTSAGAYLIWPQAFNSMRTELVSQSNSVGIPNDPTEVAEMFLRARVAMPRELSNGRKVPLWSVHLPTLEKPVDDSSPFAGLMAKLHGLSNALYIPEPGQLLTGMVIGSNADIRIARDPTLPEVAAPSPVEAEAEVDRHDERTEVQHGAAAAQEVPAPLPASSNEVIESPDERTSVLMPVAQQAQPSEDAKSAPIQPDVTADPPSERPSDDALFDARQTLLEAGPLGPVLVQIADKIATEPGIYVARDMLQNKGPTLLMRWPESVKGEVKDVRALAQWIAQAPELLAKTVQGEKVDVEANGITLGVRVRGSAWNVVPLNPALSAAFNALARRNAKPSSQDIPV